MITENEFKETEIGLIPCNWAIRRISEIASIKYGKQKPKNGERYPVIGSSGIYAYSDVPLIDFETLIVGRKGNAGTVQLMLGPCWPADTTFYLEWSSKDVNVQFLYYFMSAHRLSGEHAKTTLPSVQRQDLENYLFPVPSIQEQSKIVMLMRILQQALEQQEQIIAKTKELKRSLMQRLFTYGLRGEELKETEIGMMPESWRIEKAEEYCERVTDGTHDSPKSSETGFYLVTSKNLKNGRINFNNCYFVSESDYNEINKRSKVDIYDVLFGMIGTLGSPVLIREEPSYAIKNVGLFKNNKDELKGLWLYHYLSTDMVASLVDKQKAGATQKYIPLWFLRSFPVAVPSDEEMKEIANILEILEQKLSLEELQCNLFKVLFKSMLQLLMTGQVRVKDLDFGEACE